MDGQLPAGSVVTLEDDLRRLLQLNVDSQEGFSYAAESLTNPTLSKLCEALAAERRRHVGELHRELPEAGGAAPAMSVGAALQRTWMQLREVLAADAEDAILAELERSEEALRQTYELVLSQSPVAAAVMPTLAEHYGHVLAGKLLITELRQQRLGLAADPMSGTPAGSAGASGANRAMDAGVVTEGLQR